MCVEEHADMPRLLKSRCETGLPASRASIDGTGIRPDSARSASWARRLSSRGRVQIERKIGCERIYLPEAGVQKYHDCVQRLPRLMLLSSCVGQKPRHYCPSGSAGQIRRPGARHFEWRSASRRPSVWCGTRASPLPPSGTLSKIHSSKEISAGHSKIYGLAGVDVHPHGAECLVIVLFSQWVRPTGRRTEVTR